MKRSPLNPVSPDRDRKRENTGARGPVCQEARRGPCAICRNPHADPAHLDRVGKGYGDWDRKDGRWRCRVARLCRVCHDDLDLRRMSEDNRAQAKRDAVALGEWWAREVGVDLAAEAHPYVQHREMGSPLPGDLDF